MATMRKIGATIALEGESAFKKSVSACTTSLKTMKSELTLVSKQYADNANSLDALQAQHDALNKVLEQSQRVEQETAAALLNSQQNYAKAGDQLDEYRKQLTEAEKALNDMLDAQSKTGNVDDSAVKAQQEEVQRLTDMISRGEKEYEKAGNNIQAWQQKLNAASGEVIDLNRQIAENEQYMAEAKNATDGCATSIDRYGKKVKEAGDKSSKSMKDAADAAKEASDKMSTFFTAEKIEQYADSISEAFQEVVSSAYEAHKSVQEGYDSIAKNTGATGAELEEFKDIANDIYGELPLEMEQIGDTIGLVNQRFNVQGKELENLSTKFLKFSDITGADLPENIGLAQRVMSAFNDDASKAGDYLDVLAYTAQRTGADIGELQENTLEQAGALKELGADSMAAINFMGQLQTSGIYTEAAMGALEDAYDTCKQTGRDFASALLEVQDELLNNENEAEANQKAYDLFGESFAKVAAAIRSGNIDFTELANSMGVVDKASGSIDKTFDDTTHTYDRMTVAINKLKQVGGEIVDEVLDTAAPAVELLADTAGAVNDAFKEMPTPLRKGITTLALVGTTVGVVAPKVISLLETVKAFKEAGTVKKQVEDLTKAFDSLKTADKAADTVSDVAESVENLSDVAKTATSGAGAISNVTESVENMSDVAKKADGLTDVADDMGKVASGASTGASAVGGFSSALSAAGPYVTGAAVAIGTLTVAASVIGSVIEDNANKIIESTDGMQEVMDRADAAIESTEALRQSVADASEEYESNLGVLQSKRGMAEPIVEELEKLQSQSDKTGRDINLMNAYVEQLNSIYPDLQLSVDSATGSFTAQGKAIGDLSDYVDNYADSLEELGKKQYLQSLYQDYAELQTQIAQNENEILDAQEQAAALVEEHGLSNNPFNMIANAGAVSVYNDLADKNNKLVDGNKLLEDELEGVSDKIKIVSEELGIETSALTDAANATTDAAEATEESTGIITGYGNAADAAAEQYAELIRRFNESGGDVNAMSASFSESETALQELFNNTMLAWQTSHDQITSGLADEVASLSQNSEAWAGYRDSVMDSLQTTSTMFSERAEEDGITWDTMMGNLTANADAYAQWNENVNAILSSARYANDEAFREIANTIMTGGIESSEYLQQFVNNVDLSTASAVGDLEQFAHLQGVQDTYAGTMANLQVATENGMGAIASAYDSTKTAAQQSLSELSASMQEQADIYNDFVEYSKNIVESERYKTDENFREYANTLLQQGIAGADQVASLWQGMESGSAEVDQAVQGYMSLQEAQTQYANAWASIQTATQNGSDGVVTIVDDAGDAWQIAARNSSWAMADGVDMSDFIGKVETGANQVPDVVEQALTSDSAKNTARSAGREIGQEIGLGIAEGVSMETSRGSSHSHRTARGSDDTNWVVDIVRKLFDDEL